MGEESKKDLSQQQAGSAPGGEIQDDKNARWKKRQQDIAEIVQRLKMEQKHGDQDDTGRSIYHPSDGRSLHDPEPENRQAQLDRIRRREQDVLRRVFPEIPVEGREHRARQLRELSIGAQGGADVSQQPAAANISMFEAREQKLAEITQRLEMEQRQRKRGGRDFGLER